MVNIENRRSLKKKKEIDFFVLFITDEYSVYISFAGIKEENTLNIYTVVFTRVEKHSSGTFLQLFVMHVVVR